jgi:putative FmdB family regulatory protein
MATFLYFCTNEWCNYEYEEFHKISETREGGDECPQCHQHTMKRGINNTGGFILTGGGWARDSYNGSSNHK